MTRTNRVGLAAIALGLVGAALLHQQRTTPPIFDGIILPAAPYNHPGQPGKITYPVTNGQVGGGGFQTNDNQVVMYFAPGVLTAPASAQTMDCTITSVTNPPTLPHGAEIRGNVYQVDCVAQPGSGTITVTGSYHLTLRFPPGAFKEIQFYDGSSWHPLTTLRSPAGDPYASVNANAFGDFAATAPPGATGDSLLTILGRYIEFYGILAFVIVFGVIAVIQELRRRRKQS